MYEIQENYLEPFFQQCFVEIKIFFQTYKNNMKYCISSNYLEIKKKLNFIYVSIF